jgi:hypothetical protein
LLQELETAEYDSVYKEQRDEAEVYIYCGKEGKMLT